MNFSPLKVYITVWRSIKGNRNHQQQKNVNRGRSEQKHHHWEWLIDMDSINYIIFVNDRRKNLSFQGLWSRLSDFLEGWAFDWWMKGFLHHLWLYLLPPVDWLDHGLVWSWVREDIFFLNLILSSRNSLPLISPYWDYLIQKNIYLLEFFLFHLQRNRLPFILLIQWYPFLKGIVLWFLL